MDTIITQVQFDSMQFQALSEESQKRQLSISELLQDLIKRYFAEKPPSKTASAIDHTALIGLGDSGVTDVSERHDHYLGGALTHEHLR